MQMSWWDPSLFRCWKLVVCSLALERRIWHESLKALLYSLFLDGRGNTGHWLSLTKVGLIAGLREAKQILVAICQQGALDDGLVVQHQGAGRFGINVFPYIFRSEERRVGKECRSRWWTDH